jgi:hypothetical protein
MLREELGWIVAGCVLLVMVAPMLVAPQADAASFNKPLPAGSWWTAGGTESYDLSGTGDYSGSAKYYVTWASRYAVMSSDGSMIVIRNSETDSWTCTSTGQWASACQRSTGTDLYQTDYTIDITTLKVTATQDAPSTESNTKKEIGHPTWILLDTGLNVGDTAPQWWRVPNSDGTTSTLTDVPWKVEKLQTINVKGVDLTVRVLTYSGDRISRAFYWVSNGQELDPKGVLTVSELYDTTYGIYLGHSNSCTYTYSGSHGSWTITYVGTGRIADTNLEFQFKPPQVSINLGRPLAKVAVTVDDVSYTTDQLPKIFTWDSGSTHKLQVDTMVEGDSGIRYIFVQWSDGSKDASRSITATESTNLTATFKTQYELRVASDLGNPQGSGWYDAGSTAVFSITSPQPETGLFGSLGGRAVFQTWTGDSTANTARTEIVMDGPKTVHAEWTMDDSQPYIILGGIVVAVVAAMIVSILLTRRKKALALGYAPAPPPPTPTGPGATKYCISCGAQIPIRAKHCGKCGAAQE